MKNCERKFRKFFLSGQYFDLNYLSDMRISTVDKSVFDVHRVILARESEFFRTLFRGIKKNKKKLVITNISGDTLSDILVFLYVKYINFSICNVTDLLVASHSFRITELRKEVIKFMSGNITIENCVPFLSAAYLTNCKDLYKASFRVIERNCNTVISLHKALLPDFSLEALKQLLQSKNLYRVPEADLWEIIIDWIKKDKSRLSHVTVLLNYLANRGVSGCLASEILENGVFKNNPNCQYLKTLFGNIYQTSTNVFLNFLRGFQRCSVTCLNFSVPAKLLVVVEKSLQKFSYINISYDEHLDLWRNLIRIKFFHVQQIIAVKSDVFLLSSVRLQKFNLKENILTDISVFERYFEMFKYHDMLYFYNSTELKCFDPEKGSFLSILSSLDLGYLPKVAVLANKIFFVSIVDLLIIIKESNVETSSFINMPSPKIWIYYDDMAAYQGRIFLFRSADVETFDPISGTWDRAPKIPGKIKTAKTLVLNDKLYVFDETSNDGDAELDYAWIWDNRNNNWESLDLRYYIKFSDYYFCEIDHEETIKAIYQNNSLIDFYENDFQDIPFFYS